jgi:hypothetical protein
MNVLFVCSAALGFLCALPGTIAAPQPTAVTSGPDIVAATRDPFVRASAPVAQEASPPAPPIHADGLAGVSIAEISVRGVLHAQGRSVAFVQAPDRKHYVVTAGDRLRDGVVESVVSDGLLLIADDDRFDQAAARRQVRKMLRERPEGR